MTSLLLRHDYILSKRRTHVDSLSINYADLLPPPENPKSLHHSISNKLPSHYLPRKPWIPLSRFRTIIRFVYNMLKMGFVDTNPRSNADRYTVVKQCPVLRPPCTLDETTNSPESGAVPTWTTISTHDFVYQGCELNRFLFEFSLYFTKSELSHQTFSNSSWQKYKSSC